MIFYASKVFGCLSVYVAGTGIFGLLQHSFAALHLFNIAAMF